jgi:hypothetical protein
MNGAVVAEQHVAAAIAHTSPFNMGAFDVS